MIVCTLALHVLAGVLKIMVKFFLFFFETLRPSTAGGPNIGRKISEHLFFITKIIETRRTGMSEKIFKV